MTDAYLMEADCIHGLVWFECKECSQPEGEDWFDVQIGAWEDD